VPLLALKDLDKRVTKKRHFKFASLDIYIGL
jgi:hypothetical protein